MPVLPDVRRIGVLRASALGDLVFALPALDALDAAYPDAELVLIGRPWHTELLADRPGPVDRVIELPEGYVDGNPATLPEAARRATADALCAERFDIGVQLHGGGARSNPIVADLGARLTVGARADDAPPLDRTIPFQHYQPEVFRALEVVELAGARPVGYRPRLRVTEADLIASRAVVPDAQQPLAVIHPGVSDPRRRWPAGSFAAVGDVLARAGATILVTGTQPEDNLVREVLDQMACPAVPLAGRLTLSSLTGLLARASVVVANDTGPLHVAAAVGTPTVGIFWCGNLITAGPVDRARHRPQVSWRLDCPTCGTDCTSGSCDHRPSFVADVPVQSVTGAALDLLDARG